MCCIKYWFFRSLLSDDLWSISLTTVTLRYSWMTIRRWQSAAQWHTFRNKAINSRDTLSVYFVATCIRKQDSYLQCISIFSSVYDPYFTHLLPWITDHQYTAWLTRKTFVMFFTGALVFAILVLLFFLFIFLGGGEMRMGRGLLVIQAEMLSCFRMHCPIVNLFIQRKRETERDLYQSPCTDTS